MKIEDFKNQIITKEDLLYLEKFLNEKENYVRELNDVYPLFEDLVIDKFDRLSFFKLKTICERISRNCKDKKAFALALKLIYRLINYGEENNSNVDYAVDSALANLYEILAEIIYEGNIDFIPYSYKAKEFEIDKDSKLALEYFKKAHFINPIDKYISSSLAYHYFYVGDFYKSYAYYPKYDDDFWFGNQDVFAYTFLGCKFDEELKKGNTNTSKMVYDCFYNAYKISKDCNDLDVGLMVDVLYNMAYCYIKGIFVKKNINNGKKYLEKIDSYLSEKGKDIFSLDDPDRIIKDYYIKKC